MMLFWAVMVGVLLFRAGQFVINQPFDVAAPWLCVAGVLGALLFSHTQVRLLGYPVGGLIGGIFSGLVTLALWSLQSKWMLTLAMGAQLGVATHAGHRLSRWLEQNVLSRYSGLPPFYLDQSLHLPALLFTWVALGFGSFGVASLLTLSLVASLGLASNLTPWIAFGTGLATTLAIPLLQAKGTPWQRLRTTAPQLLVMTLAYVLATVIQAVTDGGSGASGGDAWWADIVIPIHAALFVAMAAGIHARRREAMAAA